MQQCIQISTRINSSSVHTYIFSLFYIACIQLQSNIQHGVRIEAVATSLQQGESTGRIQQFPAYFFKHPEHFYSRITVLPVISKKGRKTTAIQGLQSSSTRQNLHSKRQQGSPGSPCFIPCSSRASSRGSKHSTRQKLHSMRPEVTSSSLWCSRVAVEEEF